MSRAALTFRGDNVIRVGDTCRSIEDVRAEAARFFDALPNKVKGKPCIRAAGAATLVGLLSEAYNRQISVALVDKARWSDALMEAIGGRGYHLYDVDFREVSPATLILKNEGASHEHDTPLVGIFTSGTTGAPKLVEHSWTSLVTHKDLQAGAPRRWLITYAPGTYAWYQMVTLGMFIEGQSLIFSDEYDVSSIWSAGVLHGATAISSTPSFWRYCFSIMSQDQLRELALSQITLGGEAVDQRIIDMLQTEYPAAKITHIYASTEAGVGLVVSDGKAGFPIEWLNGDDTTRPQVRIEDNTLLLKSPFVSSSISSWYRTGDVVEIVGDRVFIVGRRDTGFLNIGGAKVAAHRIESVLMTHPQIVWCKAYSKKAPIVGSIVAVDVVLQDCAIGEMEQVLSEYCAEHGLEDWMIPRFWRGLSSIPLGGNFKS